MTTIKKNKSIEKMIEYIMDNFDFAKCHDTMKFLEWRWGGENDTPSIEKLKKSARERMLNAIDQIHDREISYKSSVFSSSGGLKATAWKNRFGNLEGIRLEFVLTDWDADRS